MSKVISQLSAVVLDRFDIRLEFESIDVSEADGASAYWVSAAWRFSIASHSGNFCVSCGA
jgi:hypothetical protein